MIQRVITGTFDCIENRETATAEQLNIDTQMGVNTLGKRKAETEEFAGTFDERFHQGDVSFIEFAGDDFVFGESVGSQLARWDIDTAFFQIARDILPEIRELQSRAGEIREALALFVAIAAEIKDKAADGICRINTVIVDAFPARIAVDSLVLAKRAEQIAEGLDWNLLSANRFSKSD